MSINDFFRLDSTHFSMEDLKDFAHNENIDISEKTTATGIFHEIKSELSKRLVSDPPKIHYSTLELIRYYEEIGGNIDELHTIIFNHVNNLYNTRKKPSTVISKPFNKKVPPSISRPKVPSNKKVPPSLASRLSLDPIESFIGKESIINSSSSRIRPIRTPKEAHGPNIEELVRNLLELYNRRAITQEELRDELEERIRASQNEIDIIIRNILDKIERIGSDNEIDKIMIGLNNIYNTQVEDAFIIMSDIYGKEMITQWLMWRESNDYFDDKLEVILKQLNTEQPKQPDLFYYEKEIVIPLESKFEFDKHYAGSYDLLESIIMESTELDYNIKYNSESNSLLVEISSPNKLKENVIWNKIENKLSNVYTYILSSSIEGTSSAIQGAMRKAIKDRLSSIEGLYIGVLFGGMVDNNIYHIVIATSDKTISERQKKQISSKLTGKLKFNVK